jgi:hypothetical protein
MNIARQQAELLARSWIEHASLAFPAEAELAASGRALTDSERMRLAQPLLTVARALMDRSEEADLGLTFERQLR